MWWGRDKQAAEQHWLKAWEKRRRMGHLGFVLVWGVGAWGLTTGVLAMTALTVVQGFHQPLDLWGWGKVVGVWFLGVLAFMGGGVWWGVLMWWCMERDYRRLLRKHGREPTPPGTGDPDAG